MKNLLAVLSIIIEEIRLDQGADDSDRLISPGRSWR